MVGYGKSNCGLEPISLQSKIPFGVVSLDYGSELANRSTWRNLQMNDRVTQGNIYIAAVDGFVSN